MDEHGRELILESKGVPPEALRLGQKFEPLYGRVIIWPADVEFTDRESLLIRPDTAKDAPETGVVIAVAEDCRILKPGDIVLFGRYAGYGLADNALVSCREDDVFNRLHRVKVRPRGRSDQPQPMVAPGGGLITEK